MSNEDIKMSDVFVLPVGRKFIVKQKPSLTGMIRRPATS